MTSIKIDFETLAYRSPVPVHGKTLTNNRFLKMTISDKSYFISTLPLFHDASLEEIAKKIHFFFQHYTLNLESFNFEKKFLGTISQDDSFLQSIKNETLFNLEAILLDIIKEKQPESFCYEDVKINQLFRANNAVSFYQNAQVLKIKIAPNHLHETSSLINELYLLNPAISYRLDGNQRFELDELITFEEKLKKNVPAEAFSRIDFYEEPLKNFYETFLFEKRGEIKIAIDESFIFYQNEPQLDFPAVIKPSLIGISPVYLWLKNHPKNRAIISSSFEHPSILHGLYFLAQLRPKEFHGLEDFISI